MGSGTGMRRQRADRQYLFFILPPILVVVGFTLYPALYGVYISLTNLHFGYEGTRFVGLENYVRLLTWPPLAQVALNTLIFVVAVVVLQISCGLGIAILLNKRIFGNRVMRGVAILPWVIPAVIIGLLFQQLFSGSRLGIANHLVSYIGLPSRAWLSDPVEAMVIMILALVWRGVPLSIILQLGGLQTIPKELYEAARIDGASRWQAFRHVTLPSLKPILMINLIMATSGTLNHLDIPLALTNGGPGHATEVIAVTLYQQGFKLLDAGYAATFATILLVINLILSIGYLMLLRKRDG
jgi:multiple sugar transport system permease protein